MPALLTIAVLEDNDALRELTVAALQEAGHTTFGVYDAEELNDALLTRKIDLLVLDLNLPGEDGLSVARRLKAVMPQLYIVMTTAKGAIEDRVAGYDSGADIYLPKPVSQGELLAAVAGLARRIGQQHAQETVLQLNLRTFQLICHGTVALSNTETTILKLLAQSPDRRAETYQLLDATQREFDAKAKASLEVQIVNLRKKIARAGYDAPAIRAIRREGYQLLCPLRIL